MGSETGTNRTYIGTSGWNYRHWKGNFYPQNISQKNWLQYYIKQGFNTVELNSSFYHLPKNSTYKKWYESVPEDFIYSIKASRYITHIKKLHEAGDSVEKFFEGAKELKEKLGPVLFQLPPGWKFDAERLINFTKILPVNHRYTFEFRNDTWWNEDIKKILSEKNIAFCIYELDGKITPKEITSDFIYVRLHGPNGKYQGDYNKKVLSDWAYLIKEWESRRKDVFFYFDNDENGYAVKNALELNKLIKK